MVNHLLIHAAQIIGIFFCAHHLWPKGVTYGEQEEWEKEHRKRQHSHSHRSKSQSKHTSKRGSDSPVYEDYESPERGQRERGQRVRRRDRVSRDYEIEYQERPRRREIEYEEEPRYEERSHYEERPRGERRASSRY